jgi:hypothetical protein
MSRWNQPICEDDWIGRYEGNPVRIRPEFATEERCSYCGETTTSGIYVRDDPATVPFPPEDDDA